MSDPGNSMGREQLDDLAAAYALGALSDEERRRFEEYLEAHPERQAEIEDYGAVANLLALAPREVEPPPELRRSIMERIGAPTDALEGRSRRVRPGRRPLWPAGLAAAAVVAAIVGLFVWNLSLQDQNGDLRAEIEEQQTYELEGSGLAQNAGGEVIMTREGEAVLMAEDLPPAPEGRVYQAWVLHDGVPSSAGLLETHEGVAATPVEGTMEGAEAVAVTVEPEGGSPMPTSDPLLTASLV